MTKRSRTALIGGVLVAALMLMGAGFPTKTVSPKQWATGVCTSVNDWVDATKTGASDLESSLTGTNPNLRDVRDALASYLRDTAHATTIALDGLKAAGTPKTPKGSEAASTLTSSFKKIRASLRKLADQADEMSIKHKAKTLTQITALNAKVNKEFSSFNSALSKLKRLDPNHKLKKAFQVDAACQALSS